MLYLLTYIPKLNTHMKRKRRSKEEGHMAALIRRKMIQRDHGDKNKYTRKTKHQGSHEPFNCPIDVYIY